MAKHKKAPSPQFVRLVNNVRPVLELALAKACDGFDIDHCKIWSAAIVAEPEGQARTNWLLRFDCDEKTVWRFIILTHRYDDLNTPDYVVHFYPLMFKHDVNNAKSGPFAFVDGLEFDGSNLVFDLYAFRGIRKHIKPKMKAFLTKDMLVKHPIEVWDMTDWLKQQIVTGCNIWISHTERMNFMKSSQSIVKRKRLKPAKKKKFIWTLQDQKDFDSRTLIF